MTKQSSLQIFEEKKVRTVWDDKEGKWYFSVLDVVEVLTDSANPTDYFKKMRKREPELAAFVGTNCPHVGFTQQKDIAKAGGSVAKAAKNQLESQLGHSVISPAKATDYILPQGKEEKN